jgi:hypothetical protein
MTKGFAGGKVDPKIAGAKGGRKSKGRTLSPEHKQKLREAYLKRVKGE